MWKPRAIISSWALSKLPLMILSNGKSVTPPWSRSHFFPSVSVHFLLVRFMQLYVLCPFFLSQIPPLCFIHVYQSCTNRLPLGRLPVPGGISQCGRWVIHHDKNAVWRQSEVQSLGDLPEKLGNWLHMRLVNHCHWLVCWVHKRGVVWWHGAVWRGCPVLQSSWEDAVTRSAWLSG